MSFNSIKPSGDEDDVGGELLGNGHHHCPVKGRPELMPAEARLRLATEATPLHHPN